MPQQNRKYLQQARVLLFALSLGITFLAVESLWTGVEMFRHTAMGLALFGLIMISLIVARIIKTQGRS